MDKHELALNSSACIHSAMRWGETVYYNICTNATFIAPWGEVDWVVMVGILAVFGTLTFMLLATLIRIILDW